MFKSIFSHRKWAMIACLLVFMLFPLIIGSTVLNAITPNANLINPKNADGIGIAAADIGIESYSVSKNDGEIIVKYSGSSNGVLHVALSNKRALTLVNNDSNGSSSIEWDVPNGKFAYFDAKKRSCTITLDPKTKEWSMNTQAEKILKGNSKEIKLMGAIAADFDLLSQNNNDNNNKELLRSLCPDYNNPVEGSTSAVQRSVACFHAGDDAAVKYSNALCIGCREKLNCDCVCVPYAGDYFYHCEQIGFPCKNC